jgi:8-oxo-dGTP pyrophosphatase MutT (NUDIX family)
MTRVASGILQLFMRARRGLTLGVRAIVRDDQGGLLLVRHSYVAGWHFPGGGVEPGETATDAVRRELREEAGIAADGEAELLGLYLNRRLAARDHVLLYRIPAWRQEAEFAPGLEIREARFFLPGALPADLSAGTRRRLDELLHGKPRSADW